MATAEEKEQREWQAENDARTLANAMAIHKDGARLKKAKAGAGRVLKKEKDRLKEQKEEMDNLKEVAKNTDVFGKEIK